MMDFISRFWRTGVIGTFLAGLLFLLPVVLTIFIIAWIIDFIRHNLGPGTFLGGLLTRGGGIIIGPEQDLLSFWLGVLIALVGIWVLGIIVRTQAEKALHDEIDHIFARVPFIRAIYNPISRVVRLATEKGGGDLSSMSVVSCRLGGAAEGVDILALLASREVYSIGGERRRLVYLPTSPLPMSGGLVLVSEHAIIPVPDMKVDDLLKIYFSLGALAPESMPKALRAPPSAPPSPQPGIGRIAE